MVIMKSVTAAPRTHRITSFPLQCGNILAKIARDPAPWGLSAATLWYTGNAANNVTRTNTNVAS